MFLDNARLGQSQWWRYLGMLAMLVVGTPLLFGLFTAPYEGLQQTMRAFEDPQTLRDKAIDLNVVFFLLLCTFACALVVFGTFFPLLHQRPFFTLINGDATGAFRWRRFWFGFGLMVSLAAGVEAIDYFLGQEQLVWQFQPKKFAIMVIIALAMLPWQVGLEEVLVRGYFAQAIFPILRRPLLVVLITGIGFALLHLDNPEVRTFGVTTMLPFYLLPGLLWGLISVLDDGLELPIGLHFGLNFFSSVYVTFEANALQTYALFRIENLQVSWVDVLVEVGLTLLVLLICSRVFGWKNWNRLWEIPAAQSAPIRAAEEEE